MNNKLKPALIGGVVIGILSVIPLGGLNMCCCLAAVLGGMLATQMYVKKSPTPVKAGDGAILGALVGLIGAIIHLFVGIPIAYAAGPTIRNLALGILENLDRQQADVMRRQFEAVGDSLAPFIIQGLIVAVLLFIFAIIGGLLGVPIFEKRKSDVPPPPPINVGGGPGGYAA